LDLPFLATPLILTFVYNSDEITDVIQIRTSLPAYQKNVLIFSEIVEECVYNYNQPKNTPSTI
jgi:hypothetical protein